MIIQYSQVENVGSAKHDNYEHDHDHYYHGDDDDDDYGVNDDDDEKWDDDLVFTG